MRQLVRPDIHYRDSFVQAAQEFKSDGHQRYVDLNLDDLAAHFDAHVRAWLRRETLASQAGWVTESIFWLVEADEFLGRIAIRHKLTPVLRQYGGHIGYEVRPSRRREGNGTEMLRLALVEAKARGINPVMLTCDETNIGSRKVIEANNGALQDTVSLDFHPVPVMRWWITIR